MCHLAVLTLAAEPAKERAFQALGDGWELLQWLALHARDDAGNEPALLAEC
jgi:hypothetical protein